MNMLRCQLVSCFILTMMIVTCRSLNCLDGFVGMVQHTIEDDFKYENLTYSPVCTSTWCVKVLIYDGHSDHPNLHARQKGIRYRCAYTGGDRAICEDLSLGTSNCVAKGAYEGLRGNFSFCCCKEEWCNTVANYELAAVYRGDMAGAAMRPTTATLTNAISLALIAVIVTLVERIY